MSRKIKEYDATGSPMAPDSSGARGGVNRPPIKRAAEFPYDGPMKYGSDGPYGRGNAKHSKGGTNLVLPKTAWDELQDAVDYSRAADGGGGITGGRVIPGTSGGWANAPLAWVPSDSELEAQLQSPEEPEIKDEPQDEEDSFVMKISMSELSKMIGEVILEEKKKKKKKKDEDPLVEKNPLDFSDADTGGHRLKRQGASNMGPYTEQLRMVIRNMISEAMGDIKLQPVDQDSTKVSAPFTDRIVSKDTKDTIMGSAPKQWDKKGKKAKTRSPWEDAKQWYDTRKDRK